MYILRISGDLNLQGKIFRFYNIFHMNKNGNILVILDIV